MSHDQYDLSVSWLHRSILINTRVFFNTLLPIVLSLRSKSHHPCRNLTNCFLSALSKTVGVIPCSQDYNTARWHSCSVVTSPICLPTTHFDTESLINNNFHECNTEYHVSFMFQSIPDMSNQKCPLAKHTCPQTHAEIFVAAVT